MSTPIRIQVDQDRLGDLVSVDEWCELEDGRIKGMRDVLGKFVINGDGNYLTPEEGVKVVGKLSINQLKEVASEFMGKAKEAAVPKGSGAD